MDIVSYLLGKKNGGVTPTGEVEITENGVHNVSGYATANVDVQPDLESKEVTITENKTTTITPTQGKDGMSSVEVVTNVSGGADLSDYFMHTAYTGGSGSPGVAKIVKKIPDDTVAVYDMSYAFQLCSNLTSFPLIDTSNVGKFRSAFGGCSSLTSFPQLNTSNVTDMYNMFGSCFNLITVPVLNTSRATDMRDMFYYCPALSNESLNNIMQMCININPSYNKAKTLSSIGLTQTQATTCQSLSNYQAFLEAGWTTGY